MREIEEKMAEGIGLIAQQIGTARRSNDQITVGELKDENFTFYMIVSKSAAGEDVAHVRRLKGMKLTGNR